MNSQTTIRFWKCYTALPDQTKKRAKETYSLFNSNPYHPSLHFKRVHSHRPIFSVRISKDYRAIGVLQNDIMIWFWIGSHSDYDKLLQEF